MAHHRLGTGGTTARACSRIDDARRLGKDGPEVGTPLYHCRRSGRRELVLPFLRRELRLAFGIAGDAKSFHPDSRPAAAAPLCMSTRPLRTSQLRKRPIASMGGDEVDFEVFPCPPTHGRAFRAAHWHLVPHRSASLGLTGTRPVMLWASNAAHARCRPWG